MPQPVPHHGVLMPTCPLLTFKLSNNQRDDASGVRSMCLNLEADNVSVSIFGNDHVIKEGDTIKHTSQIIDVPVGPGLLCRVVDALGDLISAKSPIKAAEPRCASLKAPDPIAWSTCL